MFLFISLCDSENDKKPAPTALLRKWKVNLEIGLNLQPNVYDWNILSWLFYIARLLILRYFSQIWTICRVNISATLCVPRRPEAVDLMMLAVETKQLPNKSSWDMRIIHDCCSWSIVNIMFLPDHTELVWTWRDFDVFPTTFPLQSVSWLILYSRTFHFIVVGNKEITGTNELQWGSIWIQPRLLCNEVQMKLYPHIAQLCLYFS